MKNKIIKKGVSLSGRFQKLFLLALIFIIGLVFGSITVKSLNDVMSDQIHSIIENYFYIQSGQTILQNFIYTLCSEFLILLIPFVFGMCIIGEPVMWLEPALRGLGLGLISGYLYKTYSLQGMEYFAVIILIPAALSSAITIFSCQESILMSRDIIHLIKEGKKPKENFIRLYLIRYAILLFALIIISFISSLSIYLFAAKFNLF